MEKYLSLDEVRKKKVFLRTHNDGTIIMSRDEFLTLIRQFKQIVDYPNILNTSLAPLWCLGRVEYVGPVTKDSKILVELGRKYCFIRFAISLADLKELGVSLNSEWNNMCGQ